MRLWRIISCRAFGPEIIVVLSFGEFWEPEACFSLVLKVLEYGWGVPEVRAQGGLGVLAVVF